MTGTGHSHDGEMLTTFSLQPYIDHNQSYCLNESVPNSGVKILRPHSERFTHTTETTPVTVTSDPHDPDETEDVELLLHVKFNEAVNISSLCVCGRASLAEVNNGNNTRRTAAPWKCKVFANRTDLDFDMARELKGDVELELLPPEHTMQNGVMVETVDWPIRGRKLQYCNTVTLFFGENYSSVLSEDDEILPTEITYVGFKGEGTTVRCIPVNAVYESRGMKKDHKVPDGELGGRHFI